MALSLRFLPLALICAITALIFVAPDGWYHIVRDIAGWRQITLKGVNGAIWVTADTDRPESSGGITYNIHRPVANTAQDRQQFLAYDWEQRVTAELIPLSFNKTA